MQTSITTHKRHLASLFLRPGFYWGSVVMVLIAAVGWFSFREILAARRIRTTIAQLNSVGIPTDDESLERAFLDATYREGTLEWAEVLSLAANDWVATRGAELPYVGSGQISLRLDPSESWPAESAVEAYLALLQPAFERLDHAAELPKPVWMPIQFNGFGTLLGPLQDAGRLSNCLELRAEYHLYQQDQAAALRDIDLLMTTGDAFDWECFLVAQLIAMNIHDRAWQMIRRSLGTETWTLAELETLRAHASRPLDLRTRWPRIIENERALWLTMLSDESHWQNTFGEEPRLISRLRVVPSFREDMLARFAVWQDLAEDGLQAMLHKAQRLDRAAEQERSARLIEATILANGWTYSSASVEPFVDHEDRRRLTLTSIGIKQFQLQAGTWPEQFNELEQVGLSAQDWQMVDSSPFGYEVSGETAFLWSKPPNETQVSLDRPSYPQAEFDRTFTVDRHFLVEIR